MFDMSALKGAKQKAAENQEKNVQDYEKEFNEALVLFEKFQKDQKESTIKSAAGKFFTALRCKRTQMAPYLFLSMIFLIFDEKETAREYFKTAESLESDNTEYSELRSKIKPIMYA